MVSVSTLRVGLVYPGLLGTYGDRGNAVVLTERARRREIVAELVEVPDGAALPSGLDIYVLGGGEDEQQVMAADGLRASAGILDRARANGAAVLAVCAGYQLLGNRYETGRGDTLDGLGIVDMVTVGASDRLIGEAVVQPDASTGVGTITGFENHSGRTTLGNGARPLGTVLAGGGNGDGTDGMIGERMVGTYLHGPVLARNPTLADALLGWVTGIALAPIDDTWPARLRDERLRAATARGWRARARDWRLAHG